MNIFTEIHSAYYKAAQAVLTEQAETVEPITDKRIREIISEYGFKDSALFIPEKLIPDSEGASPWGLLNRLSRLEMTEKGGSGYVSVLKNTPPKLMTALQKRWLKSKLCDRRAWLFLSDSELEKLHKYLSDTEPLYDGSIFHSFDVYADGDSYSDPVYRDAFRTMLSGLKNKEYISLSYISRFGEEKRTQVVPLAVEYSRKNDKFRFHCIRRSGGGVVINAGRIRSAAATGHVVEKLPTSGEYFDMRRCSEPVSVEIYPERNGVERFMLEFAGYEKESETDPATGKCTAKIWYDKNDETELLIMLLSFGPVINILGPEDFRRQAAERVRRQFALFETKDVN